MDNRKPFYNENNPTHVAIAKSHADGNNRKQIMLDLNVSMTQVDRVITSFRNLNGMKKNSYNPYTDEEIEQVRDCVSKGITPRQAIEMGLFDRSYHSVNDKFTQIRVKERAEHGFSFSAMQFKQAFVISEQAYLERISERPKEFPMPKLSFLNKEDKGAVMTDRLKKVETLRAQHDRLHNPNLKQSALYHKIMQGENVNLDNV